MSIRTAALWPLLAVSGLMFLAGCPSSPEDDDAPSPTPVVSPSPASSPTPDPSELDLDKDSYTPAEGDCNDYDSSSHPGAQDYPYDHIDQDCDGEDLVDVDGDGFIAEQADPGGPDCDDEDPATYPGAPELRDGQDNDCDGEIDDDVELYDSDGDGLTGQEGDCDDEDAGTYPDAVETPYDGIDQDCDGEDLTDVDADGQDAEAAGGDDCDDADASVYTGAQEIPYDGLDQDCDGEDRVDVDGDGFAGFGLPGGAPVDCDDTDATVYPGAVEYGDGKDNDCDGATDEDLDPKDDDGDGFSDAQGDCDDTDPARHPDATEVPYDGIDQDCADGDLTDVDGDGYAGGKPGGPAPADCDDEDAEVHPGAEERCDGIDNDCDGQLDTDAVDRETYYTDADGDGFGDLAKPVKACATSAGVVDDASDCDDASAAVSPAALEVCDGLDNDCDGQSDEGVRDTFHADEDGDGFGDPAAPVSACQAPAGHVEDGTDCDDAASSAYPGAPETCDTIDNDCDAAIDEGLQSTFYQDLDADGYGNAAKSVQACAAPEGYVADGTDCKDTNDAIHPGVLETCNGVDDDCDSTVDEGVGSSWYKDADGDGTGAASDTVVACTAPAGYVGNRTDCDDADAATYPGAAETCDGADDDCDGTADEGVKLTFYRDADADGYGNPASTTQACTVPAGYVTDPGASAQLDCNDAAASVHPGATEACNGVDDDCDGAVDEGVKPTWYQDSDGDGYGNAGVTVQSCTAVAGYVQDGTDCNDAAASIYPGALEVCDTKDLDEDCSGAADDDDAGVDPSSQLEWRADADKDGYGDAAATPVVACDDPSSSSLLYLEDNGGPYDCNDAAASIHPTATEVCNSADDDCDGSTDEGVIQTYYRDTDGDGYGSSSSSIQACSQPSGYAAQTGDCNDGSSAVNPAAKEICQNGIDENCDTKVDNGCLAKIVISALSNARTGNLGGISGANSLCQAEATSNGYGGVWKAFLSSSSQNVKDLITGSFATDLPVVDLNGNQLYTNWNAVFSTSWNSTYGYLTAFNGRKVDENTGASPDWIDADGWTGSTAGVVYSGQTCNDWTNGTDSYAGIATELDGYSLMGVETNHYCSQTLAVMCVKVSD